MGTPGVLNSSKSALGDFLTGAQYDQSGLVSSLYDYLHGIGHDAFRERALACGLKDTVDGWAQSNEPEVTSAETVKALVPDDAIERLSHDTGLSHNAVQTSLREVLPKAVRRMSRRDAKVL